MHRGCKPIGDWVNQYKAYQNPKQNVKGGNRGRIDRDVCVYSRSCELCAPLFFYFLGGGGGGLGVGVGGGVGGGGATLISQLPKSRSSTSCWLDD